MDLFTEKDPSFGWTQTKQEKKKKKENKIFSFYRLGGANKKRDLDHFGWLVQVQSCKSWLD